MDGWILAVVGAICAVVSAVRLMRRSQVAKQGTWTDGTVTDVRRRRTDDRVVWYVDVAYRTEQGGEYSLHARTTVRNPSPGDVMSVCYLPSNPDRAVLDDSTTVLTGVGLAVSVIMTVIGLAIAV